MIGAYLFLLGGLLLLLIGGEVLVRGAVNVAKRFSIPTMVIGLTIVSFGTSAPELLVSLKAALNGVPDIAIGNVMGSNIANLALVLGITAIILPIPVVRNTIRIDWPVMMVATLMFWWVMSDGVIVRWEGVLLVVTLLIYIMAMLRKVRSDKRKASSMNTSVQEVVGGHILTDLIMVVLGCLGLVLGADWLVDGATEIASSWGVSERVIGVTVVAFGTSVPELATSIIAAVKRQLDISVGNLIGSNIFNILSIIGITASVHDIPVNPAVLDVDIYWVLAVTLAILPLALHRFIIQRWKGLLLFLTYVAYVYLLF
jgi:cation:H+ antiporter